MKRLFEEHQVRDVKLLDGFWEFVKDENNVGDKELWQKNFPQNSEKIAVPGCWDTKVEHFDYDGIAWYKKTFFLKEKSNVLLEFEGVSGIAEIFLDGVKLGKHNGSYTSFSYLKRSVIVGEHELVVKVDNFQYPGRVMPDYSDWHLYGGIFRSVNLHILKTVWIKNLDIAYSIKGETVAIRAEVKLQNLTRKQLSDTIKFKLNDKIIKSENLSLKVGEERIISYELGSFNLFLWSPDNPNLHLIKVGFIDDDLQDRVGFRTIKVKNSGVEINGRMEKIRGVNRHHEYGDNGFAIPVDITLRDFEIIKDMGCNAVRSHYPIDRYAMDICDELGLLFWAEIPFWGRWSERIVAQKPYLKLGEKALEEMITTYKNHPSIFTWSVLNECATETPKGVYAVERLTEYAKKFDTTRPITLASNRPLTDISYKYLDIVGVNSYPGWYDQKAFNDGTTQNWENIVIAMKERFHKEKVKNLPIIITETGAGAIYGDRGLEYRKWSENTQVDIVEKSLKYALESDEVVGIFIWQFCDIRCQTRDWERRPGTFNNKGIMNRFRQPKLAYYKVKEWFRKSKELSKC